MSDQPMPKPGGINVTGVARGLFLEMLKQREEKGIATYGTTLQTNNGRNALQDALEEAVDLFQYMTQVLLEKQFQDTEMARLREENAELRRQIGWQP
jgi:hypothetical protein